MTKAGTRNTATGRKGVRSKQRVAICKNGLHRMTAENTYEHPGKGAMCRECIRDYMRDYMRERRANDIAASKPARGRTRKV
jgi:hypothetical protein